MISSPSPRHFGGSRWPLLVILLLIVAGGVLAYRFLFTRPGEAAIQLIPADAAMVLTLDTNPSPQQFPTFKRISDALKKEQTDTQLDSLLTGMLQNSPVAKEIRPYIANSMAMALLPGNQPGGRGNTGTLLLLAVTDAGKVGGILAKYGQQNTQDGLLYFQFPQISTCAALIGSYLALSDTPAPLARAEHVRRGEAEAMAASAEYKQAQAALPSDANLMVFYSPSAMEKAIGTVGALKSSSLQKTHWVAMGLTVRDKGLEMAWRSELDAQMQQSLGQIAAMDPALFKRLPAGAYGVMGFSQPGKYWDVVQSNASANTEMRQSMEKGLAEFEKQTGMSVPRDVVPGLMGDLALAVYPDPDSPQSTPDGLILINDANGADPSALAAKVRTFVERVSSENGKPGIHFASTQRNGAVLWSLDDRSQEQMRHALAGSPASSPNSDSDIVSVRMERPAYNSSRTVVTKDMSADGLTASMHATTQNTQTIPLAPGGPDMSKLMKNKAVVFAEVGHTVLLASSQKMLDKALAAYTSGTGSLADDPAYAQMRGMLPQGTQNLLLVNLPGIMEALRPTLARSMGGPSGPTPDDIVRLFGAANTGLVGSQKCDGKAMTGTVFVPLDYERLIHVISKASGGPTPSTPGALPQ